MYDMTLQQCVFTFPSEEELADITNLKDVQQRIKDIVMILSDFKRLRDINRYIYNRIEKFYENLVL